MTVEDRLLQLYAAGLSVKKCAEETKIATGKAFKLLKEAGCNFRRKGVPVGYKHSAATIQKMRSARKGYRHSAKTIELIAEKQKCHFNGMNGYGHTKNTRKGYVLVYAPEHPKAHRDGYLLLHRVIMERSIGRYLDENEVVHHINHVRSDNRIENLLLMKKSEHMSMHMRERNRKGSGNYQ